MRLICPNCDAEYEVDDAAIPREGRDVQCSACGHAWFQTHPELDAAAEAEAALHEAPEGAMGHEALPAAGQAGFAAAGGEAQAAEHGWGEASDVAGMSESDRDSDFDSDNDSDDDSVSASNRAAEGAPPVALPDLPSAAARGLDQQVLAVLKEEAEREVAARRAESQGRPVLESQTEMPLPDAPVAPGTPGVPAVPSPKAPVATSNGGSMAAAVKRIAMLRGLNPEADSVSSQAEGAAADGALPAGQASARRKSLPAIEEINRTLRASGERGAGGEDAVAETMEAAKAGRGAFRRGFVLLVGLAALIVILYTLAPLVAAKVPALEGAARAYVAAVDEVRIRVDGLLQQLIAWLKGLMGGQSG